MHQLRTLRGRATNSAFEILPEETWAIILGATAPGLLSVSKTHYLCRAHPYDLPGAHGLCGVLGAVIPRSKYSMTRTRIDTSGALSWEILKSKGPKEHIRDYVRNYGMTSVEARSRLLCDAIDHRAEEYIQAYLGKPVFLTLADSLDYSPIAVCLDFGLEQICELLLANARRFQLPKVRKIDAGCRDIFIEYFESCDSEPDETEISKAMVVSLLQATCEPQLVSDIVSACL